uniref:serine--tRNA ligase n=1 Tax=Ascaris suum TaxID=6253 RepID=F1L4J9_ASCSU
MSLSLGVLSRRLLSACVSSPVNTSVVVSRPELNFDYLLDERNLKKIRENIKSRKGIGDIDQVLKIWHRIEEYPRRNERDEHEYKQLWDKLYEEALLIPNMSHPNAPRGDESCARLVRTFGSAKRDSNGLFTAEKIAQSWRSVLYPREACGSRSYAFIGPLADLEYALLSYVSDVVEKAGFRPVFVPDIVRRSVTEACGLQQRSAQAIQYHLVDHPQLCLSGTSEMGLSDLIRGRVFRAADLPLRLTALSRCYRPEVSKTVWEARLYRVHEFTKIEMFVVCKENQSDSVLDELVDVQCSIFDSLGLHCRLLDMPTEELGASAARKFDVEAWMPGRHVFGEVSSASNCTDFQARRLDVKYTDERGKRKFAHTCNATALATSRAIIALLETYQTDRKGLRELPLELQKRLGKKRKAPLRLQTAAPLNPY